MLHSLFSRRAFATGATLCLLCAGGAGAYFIKNAPQARAQTPTQKPLVKGAQTNAAPINLHDGTAPNEVGRIPILMYHSVGDAPLKGSMARFNKLGLSISADLFRSNLEAMYKAGFYPVNVRDIFMNRLDIPKGKTPVALTFDDARASQFRYLKNGQIDPNCVVGILEAFHKKHGAEWPQRASFYVLPASKYNPVPFGQAGKDTQKFKFLTGAGYEIANHSTSHRMFSKLDNKTLQWEMTFCKKYVTDRDKQATMDTMALPYGSTPRTHEGYQVLMGGPKMAYQNKCILLASGDASYSPYDKRLNVLRVMRVGSEPGVIERWIAALKRNKTAPSKVTLRPYVSDGDPSIVTVPQSQSKFLVNSRLNGAKLVTYNDLPPASPAKKKTSVASAKKR